MINQTMQRPQQEKVNTYFHDESSYWKEVYSAPSVQTEFIRDRHAAVLKWIDGLALPAGSRVLEIGCGAGFMAIALAQRGFRVHAVDSVEAMVELAKGQAVKAGITEKLSFKVGDIYSLSFADSSFDLVIAVGVIAWLENPDLAVQEMARVAKPGGYVILTTANRSGLARLLDPIESPLLQPFKLLVKRVCVNLGFRRRTPHMVFHDNRYIDKMLGHFNLAKVKSITCGFGFSFFRRPVLPERVGTKVNRKLQQLADRNIPGFRSIGTSYIVLSRKFTNT